MQDAILEKYIERKIKQGKEQELVVRLVEKRIKQGLQANLLNLVKTHFPDELALANQQVGLIMTPFQAQELLDKLTAARTDDEVEAILLSIPHA